jgi:hypothetical protein
MLHLGTLNRSETRHFYIAENPAFLLCCDTRKASLFFLLAGGVTFFHLYTLGNEVRSGGTGGTGVPSITPLGIMLLCTLLGLAGIRRLRG